MHDLAAMPARLAAFLAAEHPERTDVDVVDYEVMTGGYSRLLHRATVTWTEGDERHSVVLVLRGDPPADKSLIHTDRAVEWELLRALEGRVAISRAHHADLTGDRLGTRTIVLEHSAGISMLPYVAEHGEPVHEALTLALADAAASYHTIAVDDLPASLARPDSWDAYLDARIDEWRQTALHHVEDLPVLRYVAAWLNAHKPPPVPLALVHGDFQASNLMVLPDGSIQMLDWELAQIGDPREDLGYFKAVAQALPPDLLDRDVELFCQRYRELTGFDEAQVNPIVISYFLILGVIGTVRRLLEGGAEFARGDNHLLMSLFNLNSIQFGQMMWLDASEGLEQAFAAAKGA